MVLIDMKELNQISKKIVNEYTESVLEKAYCTILFTHNYIIKLFCRNKREYDVVAVKYEYLWDKNMPYLSPRLIENVKWDGMDIIALVLRRLPSSANMLYKFSYGEICNEEVVEIGTLIKKVIYGFPKIKNTPCEIYKNYINNLKLQIEKLKGKVDYKSFSLLVELQNCKEIINVFEETGKINDAVLVHGNLFSGNIFYYQNQLIIIDPISYNHIARKSYPYMDLATFFVDVRLFKKDRDYFEIYKKLTCNMQSYEHIMIKLYFVLKLLVRLRFAYMENNLQDEYSSINVNDIIIIECKKIIEVETQKALCALKSYIFK